MSKKTFVSVVPAAGEKLIEPVRGEGGGVSSLVITPLIAWRIESHKRESGGDLISFSTPITVDGDQYSDVWAVSYTLSPSDCIAEGVGVLETCNRYRIGGMGEVLHSLSEVLQRFRELVK